MSTMMHAAPATISLISFRWLQAFVDVLRGYSGFGHAIYEVGEGGELAAREVTFTVKMEPGEELADFIARMQRDRVWRRGDVVRFVSNNRRLDVVQITRNVRTLER